MSHPVPLDPTTDVTSEAKLNHLCEKCSRIAYHVSTLQKCRSTDQDNPTIHLINHHESSNALITSAHAGCHLCTLLLAEIEMPMMEDMHALEAELGIKDKLADKLAQPICQIKLCGYLDKRRFSRKRDKLRTAMNPFKRSTFEWRRFDRLVSIDIVLPYEVTRYEAAGDAYIWTYTTARLFIEHQTGKSMIHCD